MTIADACNLIASRCPELAREATACIMAVRADSPIVADRYLRLVHRAAGGNWSADELASLMALVEPSDPTRRRSIQIRVTDEEYAGIAAAAEAAGLSISEHLRRRGMERS